MTADRANAAGPRRVYFTRSGTAWQHDDEEAPQSVRLIRTLGEIAVRIPVVGRLARRLRAAIRRSRLPWSDVQVGPKAVCPAEVGRLAEAAAAFKRASEPVILLVSHAMGGGTERHVADLMRRVGAQARFLLLQPGAAGSHLSVPQLPQLPTISFPRTGILQIVEWLIAFGVDRIHVHHCIGLEIDLRQLIDLLGVPFDVTVHDYYSICPRINLMRTPESGYCGEPGPGGCNACIAAGGQSGETDITAWRLEHTWLLGEAERVFCPSEDLRRRLARYVPRARLLVVPHEPVVDPAWRVEPRPLHPREQLRVGLLGVVGKHKGLDVLTAAAAVLEPRRVEFIVIGYCEPSLPRRLRGRVVETGRYRETDLPALITQAGVHAIWFPAVCPETYSYTLSAAIAAELPIVAPPLGAFAERLAGRPLTWIAEATTDGPTWARLFSRIREQLTACGLHPLTGDRAVSPRDVYAFDYVMPAGDRGVVPRRRVHSLAAHGVVTALVLPERHDDGCISPRGAIRLIQPCDVVATATPDVMVYGVDCRSVWHRSADVLVCQRYAAPTVAEADRLIAHCRRENMRLVYDLDENLLDVAAGDGDRGLTAMVLRLIEAADRVWVSTPALSLRLQSLRPDVELVPDAVDDRLWQQPATVRPGQTLRILTLDLNPGDEDLRFLATVAAAVQRRCGRCVRFEVAGMSARDLPPGLDSKIPQAGAVGRTYPGFVEWCGRQAWDIALSPPTRGPTAAYRSAVTLMHYAGLGLPIVAAQHPEHEEAFGGEAGAFLVADEPHAWVEAVAYLIATPTARRRAGRLAWDRFQARHTLARHRLAREAALRRAAAAVPSVVRPAQD